MVYTIYIHKLKPFSENFGIVFNEFYIALWLEAFKNDIAISIYIQKKAI